MKPVALLDGERIIDRLDDHGLILTTHRIREGNDQEFTSIMLESVCSISIVRVAQTWLLAAGVALFVGSAITAEYRRVELGLTAQIGGVGLVLVLCYFLTRFRVLQIASAAAGICVRIPRRKKRADTILHLIDAIEQAKGERMSVLLESRWERAR